MFVDFKDPWPPPPRWEPKRSAPKLTPRDERVLLWAVGFNLLVLLIAPIGGASIIQALVAVFSR
jgi:hypothetical protein